LDPEPLDEIRAGLAGGQFELLGSTYSQNIPYVADEWDNVGLLIGDPNKRVEVLTQALQKFEPAIKVFGNTFEASSGAFMDHVKLFGQRATLRLFESIKGTLSDANKWFESNESTVSSWADRIGRGLEGAFSKGRSLVEEWWPAISTFADNASAKLSEIWKDWGPTVASIGESFKSFLTDKDALDKILNVLKLYAAVQVGSAAMPLLSSMTNLGASASASAAAAAAAGKAAPAGAGLAGVLGTAGTIAMTVGAVTIAAQAAQLLTGTSGDAYDMFQGNDWLSTVGNLFIRKSESALERDRGTAMYHSRLIETYGNVDMANQSYQARIEGLIAAGQILEASMLSAAAAASQMGGMRGGGEGPGQDYGDKRTAEIVGDSLRYQGMLNMSGMAAAAADAMKDPKAKNKGRVGGGGGGTMKVEITINSNQAPGQIGRAVVDEMRRRAKDPRSSVHVRQFAASTRG